MNNYACFYVPVVFATCLATLSGTARAATASGDDISLAEVKRIVCASHPSSQRLAAIKKDHPILKDMICPDATADAATKPAQNPTLHATMPPVTVPANPAPKADPKKDPPPANGQANTPSNPTLVVRNSWTDIGVLGASCLQPPSDSGTFVIDKSGSKGASASFTRDYAGNNKSWAAQGIVAEVYASCDTSHITRDSNDTGTVLEKSFAIYGEINSDYNSNAVIAKKSNVDTRTAGLSGEIAYEYGATLNVFRVIPNVVFDNIKNTTAAAVKAQYLPMSDGLWANQGIPGLPYTISFNPALDLQYTSAMEHSQPLQFSGKDQSLRIGPELSLIVTPIYSPNNFFSHIGMNETFYPWYEAYTGHGSYWWANSIFYNFTQDGSIALNLSYNRGLDQNSGTMTNQYVLSLTGKI